MLTIEGGHGRLVDIIRTQSSVESIRELRRLLIHVMALVGGVTWLGVLSPNVLPFSVIVLGEIIWPTAFAISALMLFLELRGRIRIAALLRQKGELILESQSAGGQPPEKE